MRWSTYNKNFAILHFHYILEMNPLIILLACEFTLLFRVFAAYQSNLVLFQFNHIFFLLIIHTELGLVAT